VALSGIQWQSGGHTGTQDGHDGHIVCWACAVRVSVRVMRRGRDPWRSRDPCYTATVEAARTYRSAAHAPAESSSVDPKKARAQGGGERGVWAICCARTQRPSEGNQRPSTHPWQTLAIRSTQWHSVALSGNQEDTGTQDGHDGHIVCWARAVRVRVRVMRRGRDPWRSRDPCSAATVEAAVASVASGRSAASRSKASARRCCPSPKTESSVDRWSCGRSSCRRKTSHRDRSRAVHAPAERSRVGAICCARVQKQVPGGAAQAQSPKTESSVDRWPCGRSSCRRNTFRRDRPAVHAPAEKSCVDLKNARPISRARAGREQLR